MALKREMLDRGMSVEDIERVLGAERVEKAKKAASYPSATEVVVEQDGEWYAAILLKTTGEEYLVHYKGYDEEEWVTLDRIRFLAAPPQAAAAQPQTV
jgi:hypothetical protein